MSRLVSVRGGERISDLCVHFGNRFGRAFAGAGMFSGAGLEAQEGKHCGGEEADAADEGEDRALPSPRAVAELSSGHERDKAARGDRSCKDNQRRGNVARGLSYASHGSYALRETFTAL